MKNMSAKERWMEYDNYQPHTNAPRVTTVIGLTDLSQRNSCACDICVDTNYTTSLYKFLKVSDNLFKYNNTTPFGPAIFR